MTSSSRRFSLAGLVAAVHSPFTSTGELNLAAVERQAEHLLRHKVAAAFVCGTTGESHSLTCDERLRLAQRWSEVVRGTPLLLVVHVGANCLADARALAEHAQRINAAAISALSPCYFKPKSLDALVACSAEIAQAAPALPFYHYDIPSMTGVSFPIGDYLDLAGERIKNLAGAKFTNPDLMAYQRGLRAGEGRFDLPWGCDEFLLAALGFGARGAVGSSYNFLAPIFHRLMQAFQAGDLLTAREEQYRAVRIIETLIGFGYIPAAKVVMGCLGIDVGPARLPLSNLAPQQQTELRAKLESLGFFDLVGA